MGCSYFVMSRNRVDNLILRLTHEKALHSYRAFGIKQFKLNYYFNGTYPTSSTIFCPAGDKQKSINGFTVFSMDVK